VRDTAQRLLVERGDRSIAPELVRLVDAGANPFARVHALWTLEGLFAALPANLPQFSDQSATNAPRLVNLEPDVALEAPELPVSILDACLKAVHDPHPKVQAAALRVVDSLTASSQIHQRAILQKLADFNLKEAALEVAFQAALSAGNFSKPEALPLLAGLATTHAQHSLIRQAVLSGLGDWELQFLQVLLADPRWAHPGPGRGALLRMLASAVMNEGVPQKAESLLALAAGQKTSQTWRRKSLLDGMAAAQNRLPRPIHLSAAPAAFEVLAQSPDAQPREKAEQIKLLFSWPGHQTETTGASAENPRPLTTSERSAIADGKRLFHQLCAGCHGLEGEGLSPLAPPLVNSSWVLGPETRLIRIALHGVTGPMLVNGTRYEPPLTLPDMPALRDALDNAQLAAVLSYIRQDWGHQASPVSSEAVAKARNALKERELPWTEEELLQVEP
jgi:mono/diheme cytochrome c family protein